MLEDGGEDVLGCKLGCTYQHSANITPYTYSLPPSSLSNLYRFCDTTHTTYTASISRPPSTYYRVTRFSCSLPSSLSFPLSHFHRLCFPSVSLTRLPSSTCPHLPLPIVSCNCNAMSTTSISISWNLLYLKAIHTYSTCTCSTRVVVYTYNIPNFPLNFHRVIFRPISIHSYTLSHNINRTTLQKKKKTTKKETEMSKKQKTDQGNDDKRLSGLDSDRVLIILGEPDGLERHLLRDVALSVIFTYCSTRRKDWEKDVLQIFEDLIGDSSRKITPTRGNSSHSEIGNRHFFLLKTPTITQVKDFLKDTFYKEKSLEYAIFYCGHGQPMGYLSMNVEPVTAGRLYSTIAEAWMHVNQDQTNHANTYMYFNSCFSEDACFSIGAQLDRRFHSSTSNENQKKYFKHILRVYKTIFPNEKNLEDSFPKYDDFIDTLEHEDETLRRQLQLEKCDQKSESDDDEEEEEDCYKPWSNNHLASRVRVKQKPNAALSEQREKDKKATAIYELDKADKEMMNRMIKASPLRFPLSNNPEDCIFIPYPLGYQGIPPAGSLSHIISHVYGYEESSIRQWIQDNIDSKLEDVKESLFSSDRYNPSIMDPLSDPQKKKARKYLMAKDAPVISIFNVGCGDSCVFTLPIGDDYHHTFLIDGGRHRDYKSWFDYGLGGVSEVDTVFVSHADFDHIGGIWSLFHNYVDNNNRSHLPTIHRAVLTVPPVILQRSASHFEKVNAIVQSIKDAKTGTEIDNVPLRDNAYYADNFTIYVLSPTEKLDEKVVEKFNKDRSKKSSRGKRTPTEYNIAALCLLVVWRPYGEEESNDNAISMLFTSDVPYKQVVDGLRSAELNENDENLIRASEGSASEYIVDYMDIPHHGSKHDSKKALFECVRSHTYGWSSNGGKSHDKTMKDGAVLQLIIEAHEKDTMKTTVLFTFEEWAGKEDESSQIFTSNPDVVQEKYLPSHKTAWSVRLQPNGKSTFKAK